MREGRSRANWDMAAQLIVHIRLAAGSKKEDARHYHPFYVDQVRAAHKTEFAKFLRTQIERQNHESNDIRGAGVAD